MSVGFVKSIAALLVGTGFAMAQPPVAAVGQAPVRRPLTAMQVQPPIRTDVTYPQAAAQQGHRGPLPAATADSLAVPPGGSAGVSFEVDRDPSYRVYADAEFLLWHIRRPSLPPLTSSVPVGLITITAIDTNVAASGATVTQVQRASVVPISVANTPEIPDQSDLNMGDQTGGRARIGAWFDADMDLGIELGGFWLARKAQSFYATTQNRANQSALDRNLPNRTFVLPPAGATTSTPTLTSSQSTISPVIADAALNGGYFTDLWGSEINLRTSGYRYGFLTFGGSMGVRYTQFDEGIRVANSVQVDNLMIAGPAAPGVGVTPAANPTAPLTGLPLTYSTLDVFRTYNRIIAPQIGVKAEGQMGGFFLSGEGKVAVGANIQEVHLLAAGTNQTGGSIALSNALGGLFAGPGDPTHQIRTRVTVLPEVNVKLGYEVGSALRFWVGYDGMYMQHVIRPASVVSFTAVNTNIEAGGTATGNVIQPTMRLRDLDVWVQGINFGAEFRY